MDFEAPSSLRAVAALREGRTLERLLRFACLVVESETDAEDLLADAIVLVCDPEGRPWEEGRGSFLTHMRIVIRDLARRERRSARTRREAPGMDIEELERLAPHPAPDAEGLLHDARELERLRRMGATVRERIDRAERTAQVFDLACRGITRAADVATRLGCTVEEVYDSNEQIAYHAAKVRASQREADRVDEPDVSEHRKSAKERQGS
jgi:DNA-directed RNA polymerase specialized sigma24 family protein